MDKEKNIAMYPSTNRKLDNPYLSILTKALRDEGIRVGKFSPWLPHGDVSVFHIHWLEAFTWDRIARSNSMAKKILAKKIINFARKTRRNGGRVVWTAHNVYPHESLRDDPIFVSFINEFMTLITDVISMSKTAQSIILDEFPNISNARHTVIPHPDYIQYFKSLSTSKSSALPHKGARSILVFGMIRSYKQVPEIISAFRGLNADDRLIILGNALPSEEVKVRAAIGTDDRITFFNRRYRDEELRNLINDVDLAVFNFKDILNSGSVLTALSLKCPALVPAHETMRELLLEVGEDWVTLCASPLATEDLDRALNKNRLTKEPAFSNSSPASVAKAHLELYFKSNQVEQLVP